MSLPVDRNSNPNGLWDNFCSLLRHTSDFLNSVERTKTPLHKDFDVINEGWYWNSVQHPSHDPKEKICIYFNSADLNKLDNCTFPAKFGNNTNPKKNFEFIGFIYPPKESDMPALREFAMMFPHAEVCTYGRHLFGGDWQSGEMVEALVNSKK